MTTFDGKQYAVPGKCTYVASQVSPPPPMPPTLTMQHMLFSCYANCSDSIFKGYNWTITVVFSKSSPSLQTVILHVFQVEAVLTVDFNNFTYKTKVQYV